MSFLKKIKVLNTRAFSLLPDTYPFIYIYLYLFIHCQSQNKDRYHNCIFFIYFPNHLLTMVKIKLDFLMSQCLDDRIYLLPMLQEASKEDQLDLEGKCHRKKADKRYFRRGGVAVGTVQGRDNF